MYYMVAEAPTSVSFSTSVLKAQKFFPNLALASQSRAIKLNHQVLHG